MAHLRLGPAAGRLLQPCPGFNSRISDSRHRFPARRHQLERHKPAQQQPGLGGLQRRPGERRAGQHRLPAPLRHQHQQRAAPSAAERPKQCPGDRQPLGPDGESNLGAQQRTAAGAGHRGPDRSPGKPLQRHQRGGCSHQRPGPLGASWLRRWHPGQGQLAGADRGRRPHGGGLGAGEPAGRQHLRAGPGQWQ